MNPDTTTPVPPWDRVINTGRDLRARREALRRQRGVLREAVLAGRGAGLAPAAICRTASAGHFVQSEGGIVRAITCQSIHAILRQHGDRAAGAWEAAGCPDQATATAALVAEAGGTIAADRKHRVQRAQTAEAMWEAAGITGRSAPGDVLRPAETVTASGLAGETGYAMLGLGRDWVEVHHLLAELARATDLLGITHDGLHIKVRLSRGDEEVQRRLEAALATGCWECTGDPACQWVNIRRNTII